MRFKVIIEKISTEEIFVEAHDIGEAHEIARKKYNNWDNKMIRDVQMYPKELSRE